MINQRQYYQYPLALIFLSILCCTTTYFNLVVNVNAYDWTCNFFCYNNGICRHGHGKFGSYTGQEPTLDDLPFEKEFHDNGMYCTCPVGYTGLQCEIKYVVCGRDDHTCFNGSACVKEHASNTGEVYYRCECDANESIMSAPYAHNYCEHISTVFCEKSDGFTHSTSSCSNGGKCREHLANSNTKHVGCDCPDGWEGDHCEMQIKNLGSLTTNLLREVEENFTVGEIVGIIIGVCIGMGLLFYFKRNILNNNKINKRKKRSRRRGRNKGLELSSSSATNADDGGPNDTRDII